MKQMGALDHWWRKLTRNWAGVELAPPAKLPPRPLHPDGDRALLQSAKSVKAPRSEQMIALLRQDPVHIYTGGTYITEDGRTDGIRLNEARKDDPVFEVSTEWGPEFLTVTEYIGLGTPWGKRVRIGSHMTPSGYPMSQYADQKLHIYDPFDRTITEIQFIVDNQHNGFLQWLLAAAGKRPSKFSCHGVAQYSLDAPSVDARGATAAQMMLAEPEIKFSDYLSLFPHMTVGAVPKAHKTEFVPPALGTDGEGTHADSIRMGQILKLTTEAYVRLSAGAPPQLQFVLDCLYRYGVMIVDTAQHITFGLEHNKQWDQFQLALLGKLTARDFVVHQIA